MLLDEISLVKLYDFLFLPMNNINNAIHEFQIRSCDENYTINVVQFKFAWSKRKHNFDAPFFKQTILGNRSKWTGKAIIPNNYLCTKKYGITF